MKKRHGKPPHSVACMTSALRYCHITVNDPDESLGFHRGALAAYRRRAG